MAVAEFEAGVAKAAEATLERVNAARESIGNVIFGQKQVVDHTLTTLLAGGHGLLIGVPGLAKTKLVETLGIVLGLDALRIQFTPDLMPSDILGAEVMEEGADGKRGFRFLKGPIFAQLLMADEINRASPRTQSALLQAMQEHHVTVAGARHDLPTPFHVLATQNPLEQEGAYPLPEAQLDRFLMQIDVGYPDRVAERRILVETTGASETRAEADDDGRGADGCAAAGAPRADRRERRRGDPRFRARRAPWRRRRQDHEVHRLGPRPARRAGAFARRPRPRADRRPARAVAPGRRRACRAGAQAPHGADLLRPRRGRNRNFGDRASRRDASRLMQWTTNRPGH